MLYFKLNLYLNFKYLWWTKHYNYLNYYKQVLKYKFKCIINEIGMAFSKT